MSDVKIQSGIIMTGPGMAQVRHDLAVPSPDYGQLLVRTWAVALNPSDWMALDAFGKPGAGVGFDFAGEILEIGEGCTNWNVGDHIAGFVHADHAANYCNGAFREYVTADADLVMRIPDHMSLNKASILGVGVSTAAQALYQWLPLPLPTLDPQPTNRTILIYGGSSATGSIAIQLAKLSRLRVITTCSDKHILWLKSLGVDEVIDYRNPNAIETIKKLARNDGVYFVLDCIGTNETAAFCYSCFTVPQGKSEERPEFFFASLMPVPSSPATPESLPATSKIHSKWDIVYTCFGRRFTLSNKERGFERTWEASKENREFMVSFYRRVEGFLEHKRLRPVPIEKRKGGFEGILKGISLVRQGAVRGKKLVYECCHSMLYT